MIFFPVRIHFVSLTQRIYGFTRAIDTHKRIKMNLITNLRNSWHIRWVCYKCNKLPPITCQTWKVRFHTAIVDNLLTMLRHSLCQFYYINKYVTATRVILTWTEILNEILNATSDRRPRPLGPLDVPIFNTWHCVTATDRCCQLKLKYSSRRPFLRC